MCSSITEFHHLLSALKGEKGMEPGDLLMKKVHWNTHHTAACSAAQKVTRDELVYDPKFVLVVYIIASSKWHRWLRLPA